MCFQWISFCDLSIFLQNPSTILKTTFFYDRDIHEHACSLHKDLSPFILNHICFSFIKHTETKNGFIAMLLYLMKFSKYEFVYL